MLKPAFRTPRYEPCGSEITHRAVFELELSSLQLGTDGRVQSNLKVNPRGVLLVAMARRGMLPATYAVCNDG